uniref:Uncharacterized protein n=1 Tax=Cacopsylla melanoneura TaxID=428564 RepID=A0A8D8STW1_9HEMI
MIRISPFFYLIFIFCLSPESEFRFRLSAFDSSLKSLTLSICSAVCLLFRFSCRFLFLSSRFLPFKYRLVSSVHGSRNSQIVTANDNVQELIWTYFGSHIYPI